MLEDKDTADKATRASDTSEGLDQIREILLGDVVAELERRLTRLDHLITNRSNDVQHDVRQRTEIVEVHARKEREALAARMEHDTDELTAAIRIARTEQQAATAQLEQRLSRLDQRLEESIARIEREAREQLFLQAKTFVDELDRVRTELRTALGRELGLSPETEEGEHAGAWSSSH